MYNNMENVLQAVNKKYISLSKEETNKNNDVLKNAVEKFVTEMKKDQLFSTLYERVFYGGSYYDSLRVGKPDEFDLDLLFRIPGRSMAALEITNIPGFVQLKINKPDALGPTFMKLLDDKGYLSNNKVRQWMEGLVNKAKNSASLSGVKLIKSGPAMTLHLNDFKIDIDLVPCFVFSANSWPVGGYRSNPVQEKQEFFIVPKLPKNVGFSVDKYWRLSFQEQERVMLKDKRFLKPSLRLLKRLRDQQGHSFIASYYIKTIYLWEVEKNEMAFWNDTLANTFLKMFKKYIEYLDRGVIPFYWNKKNNLLSSINKETIINCKNSLQYIYRDIEKSADPFIVCKFLRTPITAEEAKESNRSIQ